MKRYERELTAEELSALSDDEIDYSDIPELDDSFWEKAKPVMPDFQERITLRVDREVMDYFRNGGPGYRARMGAALKAFVTAQREAEARPQ